MRITLREDQLRLEKPSEFYFSRNYNTFFDRPESFLNLPTRKQKYNFDLNFIFIHFLLGILTVSFKIIFRDNCTPLDQKTRTPVYFASSLPYISASIFLNKGYSLTFSYRTSYAQRRGTSPFWGGSERQTDACISI